MSLFTPVDDAIAAPGRARFGGVPRPGRGSRR